MPPPPSINRLLFIADKSAGKPLEVEALALPPGRLALPERLTV